MRPRISKKINSLHRITCEYNPKIKIETYDGLPQPYRALTLDYGLATGLDCLTAPDKATRAGKLC